MLKLIATILILIIAAGLFNGAADRELFHRGYCTSDQSYNKYADPLEAAPDTWYYRSFGLKYKEAFPLSATLLVSWTDAWHRYKALSMAFLRMALVIPIGAYAHKVKGVSLPAAAAIGAIAYAAAWLAQAIGFHIIYSLNIF